MSPLPALPSQGVRSLPLSNPRRRAGRGLQDPGQTHSSRTQHGAWASLRDDQSRLGRTEARQERPAAQGVRGGDRELVGVGLPQGRGQQGFRGLQGQAVTSS